MLARKVPPTPSLWLEQAQAALKDGRREDALGLLLRYVEVDERNEQVWLLLSELVPGLQDKIVALENVVTLNPANLTARNRLARIRHAEGSLLEQGKLYEEMGDLDMAIHVYLQAKMQAGSLAERLETRYRLSGAQLHQEVPDYKIIGPRLSWLRLAVGPFLLYASLLLVEGGFNPFAVSPLLCLGSLGVLCGAAVLVLTRSVPTLLIWYAWWEKQGPGDERLARGFVEFLGIVFLLAPFTLLLWDAWQRLQASAPALFER
jgi:tetratricopeptide (TPR) repeat protein